MSLLVKLLCVPIWLLGLWGSLRIHELDLHLGHSICGPWGCGPPVEALLGYHAFWLVLIVPVAIALGAYFSQPSRRKLGLAFLAVGLVTIAFVAGGDTFRYWKSSGSAQYLTQRFFFAMVTKIDVPMLQVFTVGALMTWFCRSKPSDSGEGEVTEIASDQ